MNFKRSIRNHKQVSIIPLINVIFLLLIFFIVTGTNQEENPPEVTLPIAKSAKDIGDQPLKLMVTDDGLVLLNEVFIPPSKITKEVASLIENKKEDRSIIIMADANMPAKRLLAIMADVQQAGITDISLVTTGL